VLLIRLVMMSSGTAGYDRYRPSLLILRVLLVPERVARVHNGDLLEVVVRWRGRDRPFQRATVPRIIAGGFAAPQAVEDVDDESENRKRDCEGPNRRKQVPEVPSLTLRVG